MVQEGRRDPDSQEDTMKFNRLVLAVTGSFSVLAAASPSLAQDYRYGRYGDDCTARIQGNGTTGAIIGGLAGAAVGANISSRHSGRTGRALIGAAAGAALGNSIARSSAKSRCGGSQYGYSASRYAHRESSGYDYGYGGGDRGVGYGYQTPYYEQPYASGYNRYGDDRSDWAPRHRHRHHEHDDDDDDDDND
jgi:uncharacterized membrane protein YeaQ/YmgE (transglycosylase-associated protein family)